MTLVTIKITLTGPPRGQGRPRFRIARTKAGQPFVSVYKDPETRAYEAALSKQAMVVMGSTAPLNEAVTVEIIAYTAVPASWSNRQRDKALAGEFVPIGKPDLDNIEKAAFDALNGIVWRDDSMVVDCHVWKFYSAEPRLVIEVRPWIGALLHATNQARL